LYFSRQSLEQSSSYEVSSYRAARYQQFSYLADLGCSIGSDTLTLAHIAPTFGLDIDLLRLSMASANLHALGLSPQVRLLNADLTSPLPFSPGSVALFFDPARRSNYRRLFSVNDYHPPLSTVQDWLPYFPAIGVKISPGVKMEEIAHLDAEVEFISLHGELKEAALWFGPLKTASHRATVLPGPYQLATDYLLPSSAPPQHITVPKSFLIEPDPAIIRSGLVTTLGEMLNASQIDPDIAYLTADALSRTPFARAWVIEDWFPFQLKRLRSYLHEHHIGHLTVKKRGSPIEPEFLIHQLRLKGDQERVLVLSQLRGDPIVMICIRV
jgi:hypothetical protein